MRILMRKLFD